MKTLYLIRHAKSSWEDLSLTDQERPLNKRGKRDAPRIGQFLKSKSIMPNQVISSPANRALSTARIVCHEMGYPLTDIEVNPLFYTFDEAGSNILYTLAKLGEDIEEVMIFGHNETFTALANRFSPTHYFDNVPTCGVVCIKFDTNKWEDFLNAKSELAFHMFPKLL